MAEVLAASASAPNLPSIGGSTRNEPQEKMMEAQTAAVSAEDAEEAATRALLNKSKSTPAPGQYKWHDDVNLKKRPVWSLTSPERQHLDLMLMTWTPASTSLQPRAPDPGEYGDQSIVGRNGLFTSPKWTWERGGVRPCLQPNPPQKPEIVFKIKPTVGGKHITRRSQPTWSVFGKDRSQLPHDLPTWTPRPLTDMRPGPGSYNLDRTGRGWKAVTRRGCTWGGRGANLHPDDRQWVPQTFGSRLCRGESSRLRSIHEPSTRCACVACPGPGRCDDPLS